MARTRRVRSDGGSVATMTAPVWHPNAARNTSVIVEQPGSPIAPLGDFILQYATVADDIIQWGYSVKGRDQQLREFWPTETKTASAVYSMASKYAAFEWELQGPPRTVGIYQRMLNSVQFGEGWIGLMMRFLTDFFTQDNGGVVELVRTADDPAAPCITMNHLDSNRCVRTGHKDTPIVYYDLQGQGHLMKWYQVLAVSEFPSPIERFRGVGYCAITRLLRAAQIMRDESVYKREKISGRFNRAIYFVSGVQDRHLQNKLANQNNAADGAGQARYIDPLVIAGLDPNAKVDVASIEFAKLPDNFDEEKSMHAYITELALAFGGDYQDFAPLPSGNMGSGQQSRMLHQKSLGKGSRLFIKMIEQIMNYRGIIPDNVRFTYNETDPSEDQQRTDMKLSRAKERQIRIMSGEITPAIARQIAVDDGDLEMSYLMQMNTEPTATTIDLPAYDPIDTNPELLDIEDPTKFTGDEADQQIPGAQTFGGGGPSQPNQSTTQAAHTGGGGPSQGRPAPTQPKPKSGPARAGVRG